MLADTRAAGSLEPYVNLPSEVAAKITAETDPNTRTPDAGGDNDDDDQERDRGSAAREHGTARWLVAVRCADHATIGVDELPAAAVYGDQPCGWKGRRSRRELRWQFGQCRATVAGHRRDPPAPASAAAAGGTNHSRSAQPRTSTAVTVTNPTIPEGDTCHTMQQPSGSSERRPRRSPSGAT